MTIKSNFFQNGTYIADDMNNEFGDLFNNGVTKLSDNYLKVTAHSPNNLSVDIAAGSCMINGIFVKSDIAINLPVTSNTSGYNRIDSVFVEANTTYNTSSIIVTAGSPSATPAPPTLQSNQIRLANILVGNNVSSITSANITDTRVRAYTDHEKNIITNLTSISTATDDTFNYCKLPNGVLIQWGQVVFSDKPVGFNVYSVTLPIAYANIAYQTFISSEVNNYTGTPTPTNLTGLIECGVNRDATAKLTTKFEMYYNLNKIMPFTLNWWTIGKY